MHTIKSYKKLELSSWKIISSGNILEAMIIMKGDSLLKETSKEEE